MKRRDFLKFVGIALASPTILPKFPVVKSRLMEGLVGVWPPELGRFGQALDFSGTSDYVNVPSMAGELRPGPLLFSHCLTATEIKNLYDKPFRLFESSVKLM